MKTYFKLALLSLILAVANHIYLTMEYFKVQLGIGDGKSLCNINEVFDCSAVAASSYSALMGIPVAIFGGVTNLILFIMVFGLLIGFSDNMARLRRYSLWLALGSVLASVIMGAISATALGVLCIFCIGAYVLSALTAFFLWRADGEGLGLTELNSDVKALFGESKSILIMVALIPVLAFGVNRMARSQFKLTDLNKMVQRSVNSWKANDRVDFASTPELLSHGAKKPSMIITEFADYRCPHCQHAAPSLEAFLKSHPKEVKLNFYVFPLDGACNEAINRKNGLSCRLAKAVYCASQQKTTANGGWKMHRLIFDEFEKFRKLSSVTEVDSHLSVVNATAKGKFYDLASLKTCLDTSETHEAIQAQGAMGVKAEVEGTPTIYVNGRKLPGGHMIPVLDAALKAIKSQ